jgi:hypothetical protein
MRYTAIPLDDLANVRRSIHATKPPGYRIRTFYLGPRGKTYGMQQRQTTRANAIAAKIAVYAGHRLVSYI